MSQLEQMMRAFVPDQAVSSVGPTKKALALVQKSSKSDRASIEFYLAQVKDITALDGGVSSKALLSQDPQAFQQAQDDLKAKYERLKKMKVPSPCVEIHARYLTLIPELLNLFQKQEAAKNGEVENLLESMVSARRVLKLQKQIQNMEKEVFAKL